MTNHPFKKRGKSIKYSFLYVQKVFLVCSKVSEKQISMAEDKEFFEMCSEGKIEELRKALARGTNPNKKLDTDGSTALHAAAVRGHLEVVALLLQQPQVDVNVATNNGSTALHLSAFRGHLEVVALLLQQPQIDLNAATDDGDTALHFAAFQGHQEILTHLLARPKTDPNVRNQEGDTPIMILLKRILNIDIQGNCLQAFVDCNKVDLDVKDPDGDGLEDLAR